VVQESAIGEHEQLLEAARAAVLAAKRRAAPAKARCARPALR